jgi:N-acetylmuramoyl-L-alanine amidase
MKVVVSVGHGGMINGVYQTPGKQYHFTDSPPMSVYEGVLNREIGTRVVRKLISAGVEVHCALTGRRLNGAFNWPNEDVSLTRRVANSNAVNPDLYLSIHCNAIGNSIRGPSLSARGFFLFTTTAGAELGRTFLRDIHIPGIRINREPIAGRNFTELTGPRARSLLVECGFFTNRQEALYMMSEAGQEAISDAIVTGTLDALRATRASR